MSTEIRVPSLGVGMTEGNFVEWFVTDGQEVKVGDTIYALETGKAIEEIPATAAGKIRCVQGAGQMVQVGDLLGHIE
jgi:pyruvate/2-oxoglutarate dehydrogenase complex dihydrolipoamide acyltransferase (E2) component